MNQNISKIAIAAIFAVAVNAQAEMRSKAIIVEFPSDLPELAQSPGEAMYLHHTSAGQVILYLEQHQGKKLAFLDVTDPTNIKAVGQVSIDAPFTYDFVQDLSESAVLIRYRNHSGFAVISFKDYKQPVLKSEPAYLHPGAVQHDVSGALLIVSKASSGSAPAREPGDVDVVNISNPTSPTPLATVSNVVGRLDRPSTGTVFLLNDQGLTVVRCLAAEQAHQTAEWQRQHPG